MIGRLRGVLLEKQPPEILLEVAGVGYEVFMPMTCIYQLPNLKEEIIIFTHLVVREDAQVLYGFNHKKERSLFREVIKISGVGPKLALAILSTMPAVQFIQAVQQNNIASLVNIPGIGKKTAERLLIELRDRMQKLETTVGDITEVNLADTVDYFQHNTAIDEAVAALVALGYRSTEAVKMINKVQQPAMESEALIRAALKQVV